MPSFILRRLLGFVPTLLAILLGSFMLIRYAPGSPFDTERATSPEVRAVLEAKYGFDKPWPVQFVNYLANLSRLDLGPSTKYPHRTVNEIIAAGFPVTLALAGVALSWSLALGITAGVIGAIRQNSWWDYSAMSLAMIGISIPSFVMGPLLALVFALKLHWLPAAGWGSIWHVIMPGLTLGTAYAAYIARLTRSGMLEVSRMDYIRTARAKGLRERVIVVRHMLKGGLLPVVSFLGPAIANMLVGSLVVERIFNTPGIGPYFVDSALNRDLFLLMGVIVIYATVLLTMNLIVDIVYAFLDPRIRYE